MKKILMKKIFNPVTKKWSGIFSKDGKRTLLTYIMRGGAGTHSQDALLLASFRSSPVGAALENYIRETKKYFIESEAKDHIEEGTEGNDLERILTKNCVEQVEKDFLLEVFVHIFSETKVRDDDGEVITGDLFDKWAVEQNKYDIELFKPRLEKLKKENLTPWQIYMIESEIRGLCSQNNIRMYIDSARMQVQGKRRRSNNDNIVNDDQMFKTVEGMLKRTSISRKKPHGGSNPPGNDQNPMDS